MQTITLKIVVEDGVEEMEANKNIEDMLSSTSGAIYEWSCEDSTKKEIKFYKKDKKDS